MHSFEAHWCCASHLLSLCLSPCRQGRPSFSTGDCDHANFCLIQPRQKWHREEGPRTRNAQRAKRIRPLGPVIRCMS